MVTVNIRGGRAGGSQNDTSPAVIIIPGWDESNKRDCSRLSLKLLIVVNQLLDYYKGKLRNVQFQPISEFQRFREMSNFSQNQPISENFPVL